MSQQEDGKSWKGSEKANLEAEPGDILKQGEDTVTRASCTNIGICQNNCCHFFQSLVGGAELTVPPCFSQPFLGQ